jgi:aryl-alcohol dehydrogenase-like predicted oxidoreductase
MVDKQLKRRDLVGGAVLAAGGLAAGNLNLAEAAQTKPPARRSILNFNENMEYRRLGKTNLMVSAVCLGGHWKRMDKMVPGLFRTNSWLTANLDNPDFMKNRHDVVSRCIELGINYIDACTAEEVQTYSRALKGRRDKMYLGYSWYQKEPRFPEYRNVKKLMEALDEGLKTVGLDYVDVWRVTLPWAGMPDLAELKIVEEATFEALEKARQQGKVRFTGLSTHNRVWLKSMIEEYPKTVQVVCTPYTADSKELPTDSVFGAIRKFDVGVFGIKPFADNALFKGDGSLTSPAKEQDDRLARLALRYVLNNPAITAPIPGMINVHQVENAAMAVAERRKLDAKEKAELDASASQIWAKLKPGYQWLKDWEYV